MRTTADAATRSAAAADRAAAALAEVSKLIADLPPPAPPAPAPAPAPEPEKRSRKPAHHLSGAAADVDKGDRALRKGQLDDAATAFAAALASDGSFAPALRGLAMVHMTQGNEQDARREFEKYLALAPSAPDAGRIRKVVANLGGQP